MTSTPPAPPGWYVDPASPGWERRWNGSAWVGSPHKTPAKPSLFGPDFDRAYWANANRPVQIARWVGLGGMLPIAVGFFLTLALQPEFTPRSVVLAVVLACAISIVTEITSIVLAAVGIARAQRGAGALAFAVQILVASSVLLLFAIAMGAVGVVLLRI